MTIRPPVVLLLAGDGLTRRTTASCLESFGHEVVVASSGAEAVALLQADRRISVLVTDADIGGEVDGLAAARTARQINPKISVIYTSRFPHAIPEARKVRGAPSLRTPYFPQQIVGIIGELRAQPSAAASESRAA